MSTPLISKKTLYEFEEFFVGYTLREIEREFDAADIDCATDYVPNVGGQRRSLVAQYYHTLDMTKWEDVRRLLRVFENVLSTLQHQMSSEYADEVKEAARRNFDSLSKWLHKDGSFTKTAD